MSKLYKVKVIRRYAAYVPVAADSPDEALKIAASGEQEITERGWFEDQFLDGGFDASCCEKIYDISDFPSEWLTLLPDTETIGEIDTIAHALLEGYDDDEEEKELYCQMRQEIDKRSR